MRLSEFQLTKNKWEVLLSTTDKIEAGGDLTDLVKNAYSNTPKGSLVNSLRDVIPSDWHVIDWDKDPDIDSCIFYRDPRPGETWSGEKIQGIGHDSQRQSKDKAISKLVDLLNRSGWWIESSDALRHVIKKNGLVPLTDEEFLKKLFGDPELKMISPGEYQRHLPDGTTIEESVFGNPILK